MKAKILAGAVGAFLFGTAALAQETAEAQEGCPPCICPGQEVGGAGQGEQVPGQPVQQPSGVITGEEEVVPSVPQPQVGEAPEQPGQPLQPGQEFIGGAGRERPGAPPQPGVSMQMGPGVTLYCTPVQQPTGGAGIQQPSMEQEQMRKHHEQMRKHEGEQSSILGEPGLEKEQFGEVEEWKGEEAVGGAGLEEKNDMRGLTLLIGGGVEGYTGELAPLINPGAAASVTAAIKPSRVLGFELGYSGAANYIDNPAVGGTGVDIVRHGGQAAITFGLAATAVQPYVLGGFGLSRYVIRNGENVGFRDDVGGNLPVGLGLRTHFGDFTADARVNYNFLFDQDFAPIEDQGAYDGRYYGSINVGGTF